MISNKREAARLDISLVEWLRCFLRGFLPMLEEGKPWMRYSGMVASDDPQASHSIDATVYEQ